MQVLRDLVDGLKPKSVGFAIGRHVLEAVAGNLVSGAGAHRFAA